MVDTATAIEGDLGDAGLDGALANELTDLLRSLLVRGVGALELGLEGRGRDERQAGALAVVDDLGIDVGVSNGSREDADARRYPRPCREHDADDA